jgi:Na+-translocating ferredoxin:NAD+ oxidoreductase RNF subunit RnfB
MIQILIPVLAMAALGLIFGLGLAYTLKIFGIEVDPKVFLILSKLPGSNCGACGKAGCAGFAEALEKGEAVPYSCVLSNDEARKAISEILGIEYNSKVKTVATLRCNGGKNAKDKFVYHGIKSCKAASLLFDGPKACTFGCLGLATASRPALSVHCGWGRAACLW